MITTVKTNHLAAYFHGKMQLYGFFVWKTAIQLVQKYATYKWYSL